MNKYIKITNKAESVNRLSLEKLGLSTKRNDPATIGQFGSGIKYAPIAALRKGLEFVFTGSDANGKYELRYSVVEEDGIKCVVYDYGTYQKPSSFTVDAGILSWEDSFQIYREAVSNAKDSGEWTREIVDAVVNNDGEFSVFITASPEMMEIYNNHDIYFCENRKVLMSSPRNHVRFLEKLDNVPKIYCKTVLVYEDEDSEGVINLFDYELNEVELNEDRALKDINNAKYKILSQFSNLYDTDLVKKILTRILSFNEQYWEFSFLSDSSYSFMYASETWKECFYEMYGDNAVLLSPEQTISSATVAFLKSINKKPVGCSYFSVYNYLTQSCRISSLKDVAGEELEYDIDTDIEKYPALTKALKIAQQYEPSLMTMEKPIGVIDSNDQIILGLTINMNKPIEQRQILIDVRHAQDASIHELVGTIIHEYDHYSTGITDSMEREFRNLADRRIGKMMASSYKETLVSSHNGLIKIKAMDLVEIQSIDYVIEYFKPFACHFMRIGKQHFTVDIAGKQVNKSGVAMPTQDGSEFVIEIGADCEVKRLEI